MKYALLVIVFVLVSTLGYSQSCTLTVDLTAPNTAICSGTSVVLTATASAGTGAYSYVWSTGETTSAISVNKAGTYTVTVGDNTAGCQSVKKSITITSTITPNAPTAGNVAVCQNTTATLTATAPGGVYQWYDAPTGGNFLATGAIYNTPAIASQTTFYVETTLNGCTSPRTAVIVFVYGPPGVNNTNTCAGNSGTLTATGYPAYIWYDAPSGGNQLSTSASYTTPPLTTTTTYYVAGVINGCTTARSAATVFITAAPQPPTANSPGICAGSAVTLHADAPAGNIDWFTTPTGGTSLITSPDYTTPPLTVTTTYYAQVTTGCVSERTAVTVTVNPIPTAPTIADVPPVCVGTSAHLTAPSTSEIVYQWYSRSVGGRLLATGDFYDTPALTRSTTYYVQADNGGCSSGRTAVTVKVSTPPDAPTAEDAVICPGTAAKLTATAPGGTYQWYDAQTGGNLLFTGDTYTTPVLNTAATYYVQVTSSSGCVSERTPVSVSLYPITAAPTASGTAICSGSMATLTATGGASYQWYDAATAGNKLNDGAIYTTPALLTTTTYYVQATSGNGCISTRTAVTVTVNPTPSAPNGTGMSVCTGSAATLNASTSTGTIAWYDAATGGNLLATGNSYTTPPLANTTTYYAEATTGTCASARTAVVASIITGVNPQFQYPFNTVCSGVGSVSPVINNPAGGAFSASPVGLVFVNTTTGEINTNISVQGTYTISFTNNGPCPSVTTTKFTIGSVTDPRFTYATPFCQEGTNPTPIFPGQYSAGVFSASPAGLVFINTSTGEIDLANSAPGTYTITNTIGAGGACAVSSATFNININPRVTVSAGPNQSVQNNAVVQLAGSITGGATTGTWSGGAGAFSSTTELNPTYTPAPGETSATLTLTSADPPGPCGAHSATVTITFGPAPAAPTVSGTSICTGSTATLTATAPGGTYNWYSAATGGTLLFTGPDFATPALSTTTTYYVSTNLNGGTSARTAATVTVNPAPSAPVVAAQGVCARNRATLMVSNPAATLTYQWYDAANGGNLLATGNTYTTRRLNSSTSFFVEASSNGCSTARTKVDVTVSTPPTITSTDAGDVCSGNPLNYTITADIPTAAFVWGRAQVNGISNPSVTGQTASTITEVLVNTTNSAIDVTYTITPVANGCSGAVFNYVVTVYPNATVTSPAAVAPICNGNSSNYTIAFSTQVSFSWARAAVEGISNAPVSGQVVNVIRESLLNTTNAPVDVIYVFTYSVGNCTNTFDLKVTVNPPANITSAATGAACSKVPQSYTIQSNIPTATFNWSRAAVAGISNAAVSSQTSNSIIEALVNTTTNPIDVNYVISASAFGCSGAGFNYKVTVNPIPVTPVANGNSPVCINSTIQLRTATVANATYLWTGPNGYISNDQNPDIPASLSAAGDYTLFIIINGCSSAPANVKIIVDNVPVTQAGPDQIVCPNSTAIQLAGSVTGGTTSGIWTTSGSGTFLPAGNALNAQYIPSAQDKTDGKVTLTLMSTSKDDCAVSSDDLLITFGLAPASNAGPDQEVCTQVGSVVLNGTILIGGTGQWTTSGTGSFSPSATQLNAQYLPSAADVAAGKVTLTLTATNAGSCYALTDDMVIAFTPPPTVNAGGTRYVLKGKTITLDPVVGDENVTYAWSPNIAINDTTVKRPVVTGTIDRTYTLTITDSRGCVSTSQVNVKVSPALLIPNTFTPNGDGINDTWKIDGLIAYQDATVDIFNRDGQKLFHSIGYPINWDGTFNGRPVPVAVYYYVIDTKVIGQVLSGYVTVIR